MTNKFTRTAAAVLDGLFPAGPFRTEVGVTRTATRTHVFVNVVGHDAWYCQLPKERTPAEQMTFASAAGRGVPLCSRCLNEMLSSNFATDIGRRLDRWADLAVVALNAEAAVDDPGVNPAAVRAALGRVESAIGLVGDDLDEAAAAHVESLTARLRRRLAEGGPTVDHRRQWALCVCAELAPNPDHPLVVHVPGLTKAASDTPLDVAAVTAAVANQLFPLLARTDVDELLVELLAATDAVAADQPFPTHTNPLVAARAAIESMAAALAAGLVASRAAWVDAMVADTTPSRWVVAHGVDTVDATSGLWSERLEILERRSVATAEGIVIAHCDPLEAQRCAPTRAGCAIVDVGARGSDETAGAALALLAGATGEPMNYRDRLAVIRDIWDQAGAVAA